jgi:hypothetical protein
MIDLFGVHCLNEGQLVSDPGCMRQQLAHPCARIAPLGKAELRRHNRKAGLGSRHPRKALAAANGIREIGTLKFFEARFVIKKFELRRSPGLEKIDNAFSSGGEVGKTGKATNPA